MPDEDLDQTGVTDPDAGGGDQDLGADDNQPITREAFIAMRQDLNNKLSQITDQNALYKTQLALLQNQGNNGNGGPRQEADDDPFSGRDEEDVVTVAEMRQILSRLGSQIGASIGELRQAANKSDYAEVVKTHLPNYLQSNPEMVQVLKALPPNQRPALAYTLGTMDPAYQAKKAKGRLDQGSHEDVNRIAANKRRPQLGGKGGGSPLAKANLYESMSDAELERTISQVKSGRLRG